MAVLASPLFLTECRHSDDIVDVDLDIDASINPKQELSPEDQKEYLEAVALAFMERTPASDFETYADLINYCTDEFEDYDWDDVEDWAEDAWNALLVKRGSSEEKESSYYYDYVYHYTNYDALIAASNFTGHFEARGGSWHYTKANDLQFIFKDQKGQECVAKLTTGGGSKEVYVGKIEGDEDWDYSYDGNKDKYDIYEDNYNVTIKVPEKINVTLFQGGKNLVSASINIDLSSLSGNKFTTSSALTVSSNVELSNGYKVNVNQVKYSSGKSAEASFSLANGAGMLINGSMSGNIKDLPNYSLDKIVNDEADEDDFDYTTGDLTYVKLNILGKVQFEGSINDVRSFIDYLDESDGDYNESEKEKVESALKKANKLMNAYVYYDNNGVRQAQVTLEGVLEDTWYGENYYEVMPVLNFTDGSRYSTFEAFFNDKDFSASIKAFKRLVNKYCDLIDEVDRVY